jgi:hypothetical protein
MKKISLKTIYKTLLVGVCLISTISCRKSFEKLPQNTVDVTNAYQNVYDANAAVLGIYGKFMSLADRYIILNELRADLVSTTTNGNADLNLKQLNEHTETADNPWVDPKPWYNLILSMNDAMYHFDDMYKTGRLNSADYQERYSDIGALRCWVYLQLGIQYGDHVRYITDPLSNLNDLKDSTKYPAITFPNLLTKLITFMDDPARVMGHYTASNPISGSTSSSLYNISIDGQNTNIFFINKYVIKGDLHLWAGAFDAPGVTTNYHAAALAYKQLIDAFESVAAFQGVQYFEQYKVSAQTAPLDAYSTHGLSISYKFPTGSPTDTTKSGYILYDGNDQGWREIFAAGGGTSGNPSVTAGLGTTEACELIWQIPYLSGFAPVDPLIDLFSNRGGKYLLKPSQQMMDLWDGTKYSDAIQTNGFNYDARGKIAVKNLDGQLVIMKDLYYYLDSRTGGTLQPINPLNKVGRWTLMRAGDMLNRFAEAALNDNQPQIAYALLNKGLNTVLRPAGASDSRDAIVNYGDAYMFDARSGGPTGYLGAWYREAGTRSRALLKTYPDSLWKNPTDANKQTLENYIIRETAREDSFEGYRWGDLLRIAIHRRDPSFIADKIQQKLDKDGNGNGSAAHAKLMTNYYLPFKL